MGIQVKRGDALLVVDVQRDFCAGGSLAVSGSEEIIPNINKLIGIFSGVPTKERDEIPVIFTKDWHTGVHDGWPAHCIEGSAEIEFHSRLDVPPGPAIFIKGMDADVPSYSGFEGVLMDLETNTPFEFGDVSLDDWLELLGVKRLFVVGLAMDYCVKATVLDGLRRGFNVYVVTDATAAVNSVDGERALWEMSECEAKLCMTGDIEIYI